LEHYPYAFDEKRMFLSNIDKLYTTEMGVYRIKRYLKITTDDVIEYCKHKIQKDNCNIYRQGKNWYCDVDGLRITVNSYSYTIISAHHVKK
jgi:hypothetical protein